MRSLVSFILVGSASTALLTASAVSVARAEPTRGSLLTFETIEDGLRFGAEWTLTSDALFKSFPTGGPVNAVTTPYSRALVIRFQQSLEKKYENATKKPVFENMSSHSRWTRDAFSIQYPNNFKMTVFTDPGVLEINSSPSSLSTLKKNRDRIQGDIFDQGKDLGVEPGLFAGSGHMHVETTRLHPDTVRNFLAAYYNHTGLAAGALNEDVFNSLGPGEMSPRSKAALQRAFELYDASDRDQSALARFVENIQIAHDVPLEEDLQEYKDSGRGKRAGKYFAVSFKSFFEIGTIEIRAIRPQASADAYLKLAHLWAAQMKVAEFKRQLGILVPIGELQSHRGNPQAVIADFDHYLEEAGLRIEDYREFVLPWWQGPGGEVENYITAKALRAPKICVDVFNTKVAPSANAPAVKSAKASSPKRSQTSAASSLLNFFFGSVRN